MTAPRIPRHNPLWHDTIPAPRCSGPCRQGRRKCPTPAACQGADRDPASDLPGPAMALVIAVGLAAMIAAVSLAVAALAP